MIFKVEQTKTNFNMVWMAEDNSESVCVAISPFEKGQFTIDIDYSDGTRNKLYYNPSDTSYGLALKERLCFKLFDETNLIGNIVGLNRKVKGFLQSYPYRVLTIGNDEYFLYEVGFGSKGLYLCIYKGEKLIAIAEKELVVINYQDKYTVYTTSAEWVKVIMPMLLQYDMTSHGDMMEISMQSVARKKVNTIQKELIAKYDPNFIPMIKAMHGINQ